MWPKGNNHIYFWCRINIKHHTTEYRSMAQLENICSKTTMTPLHSPINNNCSSHKKASRLQSKWIHWFLYEGIYWSFISQCAIVSCCFNKTFGCNFLIHFMLLISFDTPWKHPKTWGFLIFSGGIESEQWHKMGKTESTQLKTQIQQKKSEVWPTLIYIILHQNLIRKIAKIIMRINKYCL